MCTRGEDGRKHPHLLPGARLLRGAGKWVVTWEGALDFGPCSRVVRLERD